MDIVGNDGSVALEAGPTTAVSRETAARSAIVYASCVPGTRLEEILRQLYRRVGDSSIDLDVTSSCIASGTAGCGTLTSCAGLTITPDAGCETHCEGEMLVRCDDQSTFSTKCSFFGETCLQGVNGSSAACTAQSAPACDPQIATVTCTADGRPTKCGENGRQIVGVQCSLLGLSCGAGGCSGNGEHCNGESDTTVSYDGLSCDGDRLSACVNGGTTILDCSSRVVGATCQRSSGGSVYCGFGVECDPLTTTTSCDGDSVVLCNGGAIDRVDCTSLGFARCVTVGTRASCE